MSDAIRPFRDPSNVRLLGFSGDGKMIALVSRSAVVVCDTASDATLKVVQGDEAGVTAVAPDARGALVAVPPLTDGA